MFETLSLQFVKFICDDLLEAQDVRRRMKLDKMEVRTTCGTAVAGNGQNIHQRGFTRGVANRSIYLANKATILKIEAPLASNMTRIPKNNLNERMTKLGYNCNSVRIVAPVLDNSKVVVSKPPTTSNSQVQPSYPNQQFQQQQAPTNFNPPPISNIDDWSDFEDD